ncbi:MAG: hypothetical protein JXA93_17765 [Anaerolineae bacterium]|nr:hypothetical protein [Anaerolineae bacterium]
MKLTMDQVEAKMSRVWNREVFVVPYRLAGNRYTYAASDHGEHWLPLKTSWVDGRQVFEPADGDWPEPRRITWEDAVLVASQLAMNHFLSQHNRAVLKRLPRAATIAEMRRWTQVGDAADTWLFPSSTNSGVTYHVNGRCTCPDYIHNGVPGGWCQHRLARALAKRAEEILKEQNRAGNDAHSPVPQPAAQEPACTNATTQGAEGQTRRVELIVAYQANEVVVLPRVNGNGQVVTFRLDGNETTPPAETLPDIYRWLQAEGYVPGSFQWLGWEHGLRQRKQTYIRTEVQA